MKLVYALLSSLWKFYFFTVIFLSILVLYPLLWLFLTHEKFFRKGFHLTRYQAKVILFLVGIRCRLEQPAQLPSPPYIICPNHTSYLDILVLYATCDQFFVFLGKKELGAVPLFNIYFKQLNLLVDRRNPKMSKVALEECANRLKSGCNVVIFPEGTISSRAPQMRPFKNGAFKLAIELGVPIIPVTMCNNYKVVSCHPDRFWDTSRPGVVDIIIHQAVPTNHLKVEDCLLLSNQINKTIASKLS
ncbi:lysophospholipid acyltransferase family protein [Acidiluteibacter ferrifornacis]|uniref:1-acyl-sn-glycerol-3-phosphate acyltransferase n=1 Tax=Acidiluteibacter ferrifornacis TaxID=2692424 RepID=A0A6N9NGH0_9FLAO|nr:lysophospholipid acyltransferase family protein [Acidiluteibacter ferrifornacis]NBG64631.1 1-acylglycerol-3-phosphate O-acyltransferase [Acidiluteibacter ferrifornacis]